jgi:hypothetical protein
LVEVREQGLALAAVLESSPAIRSVVDALVERLGIGMRPEFSTVGSNIAIRRRADDVTLNGSKNNKERKNQKTLHFGYEDENQLRLVRVLKNFVVLGF